MFNNCQGTGACQETASLKVKIPAGIDNGETIRLSGQGEAGERGASPGDLYLKIKVNPDRRFERDGYNILSQANINFTQAALGDKIEVATVDGQIKLKIPAGTQSGMIFKLRGRGVTKLPGRGPFGTAQGKRGDQFVEVIVKTPTNLGKKQKDLFKDLNI